VQAAAPVPKRYRGMPFRCASGEFTRNEEPTFEALLAEPIVRLVMARDHVEEAFLRRLAATRRRRSIEAGAREQREGPEWTGSVSVREGTLRSRPLAEVSAQGVPVARPPTAGDRAKLPLNRERPRAFCRYTHAGGDRGSP
jgi:hypothetical protein